MRQGGVRRGHRQHADVLSRAHARERHVNVRELDFDDFVDFKNKGKIYAAGKGRHFNVECYVICWPNVGFEYVILALALALCQR